MPRGDVDIRVRLLQARKFQAEAKATAASLSPLERRAKAVGTAMVGAGQKMSKAGTSMTKKFTLPVAVGLGVATKVAMDFEKQVDVVGAVSGATGGQLERLRQQAIDMGAATVFSASDAARAQTELAKGGLDVQQVMGALPGTLDMAASADLELADAATFTANALKLFRLDASRSTAVADAFAMAANKTTADVEDFAMALRQGGGVASMAGKSFNETTGWLMALADAGIKNSDAGTSMKTAIIQLLNPSQRQAEAAWKAGLNFKTQAGEMKSTAQISDMLRRKTGDMTKAQRTALLATVAGTDGVRALNALYSAGPKRLARYEKALAEKGTAAKIAEKRMGNLAGKVEALKGSAETAAILVGTMLIPVLSDIAQFGVKALNAFSKLPQPVKQGALAFVLLLAAIGPALAVLGFFVTGIGRLILVGGFLLRLVNALRFAFAIMWIAGLGPIAIIIAAVIAVGVAFVVLYKKVGWFRKGVQAVWGWIKKHWPLLVAILTGPVGIAVMLIVKHFAKIKAAAVAVLNFLKPAWNALKPIFEAVGNVIKASIIMRFEALKAVVKWVADKIAWVLGKADAIGDIAGKLGDLTGGAADFLNPFASGGVQGRVGPALVGERGPEVLQLPAGAKISPIPQGPLVAAAGGGDITLHNVIELDGRVVAENFARRVRMAEARK